VPALWKDLYIGVIWGVDAPYRFNGPDNWQYNRNDLGDITGLWMTIGLCNSSGSIPYDLVTGSVVPYNTYVSNSVFVCSCQANNSWQTSSLNNQFLDCTNFVGSYYANVRNTAGAGTSNGLIPAYDGQYKMYVVKFTRTAVSANSTMSITISGYDIPKETANETPMTGSTALAEALNRTNINAMAAVLTPNYANGSSVSVGIFNETTNGEFDELFISYGSNTCPLKIACVATKVVLS
jgi:hypothetical protein